MNAISHRERYKFQSPEDGFEFFYRDEMNWSAGNRVTLESVVNLFNAWAAKKGVGQLWYRQIKRELARRGHEVIHDRIHFVTNIAFVRDVPAAERKSLPGQAASEVIASIDRMMRQMAALRASLVQQL